jgi:hypothetical protein
MWSYIVRTVVRWASAVCGAVHCAPHIDIRSSQRRTADAVQADNTNAEGVIEFLYKYMDAYVFCVEKAGYCTALKDFLGFGIGPTVFQIGTHEELGGQAEEPRVSTSPFRHCYS